MLTYRYMFPHRHKFLIFKSWFWNCIMSETTIEKQSIYFPPLESKWNHMQYCRSQQLGKESKPKSVVDHSEPEQPLPSMTELHSVEKHFVPSVWISPVLFFKKVIANQKGTVDKALGSIYTGNYWQLELDSQRNSWNNPEQIKVKLLLLNRVEVIERVYLSGESHRYRMTCIGKFTQKWELLVAISQLHSSQSLQLLLKMIWNNEFVSALYCNCITCRTCMTLCLNEETFTSVISRQAAPQPCYDSVVLWWICLKFGNIILRLLPNKQSYNQDQEALEIWLNCLENRMLTLSSLHWIWATLLYSFFIVIFHSSYGILLWECNDI